ncbi:helix-turn-helix domain-containing protein [Microbispora catharanthi]|uniref:Winged helix-turn helix domain-containing protein n=1 Tax=Microbispora catharanthi TaxID=1712871 RepID=A0A5N6BZN2_9ACTN|nr:winged helix-turn-helix domain-containing protein [Microbispora catharanthi]KAB8185996.1 hypothetical protein FH610_009595 [Microbispora catharanthi]
MTTYSSALSSICSATTISLSAIVGIIANRGGRMVRRCHWLVCVGVRFHIGYTVQGVWYLLRRNGWSCQRPARRAIERDEAAIEVWKEVWPQVEDPRRPQAPGSASKTKPVKG